MSLSYTEPLLKSMLGVAVPLHIIQLKARGGPTTTDFQRAAEWTAVCSSRGDNLLFRSKKPGETAALFNGLALAIAVLSFVPGGVDTFGFHFETILEEHLAATEGNNII